MLPFLASFSFIGCLHLDVTENVLDIPDMKAFVIPTNPSKPESELDLKDAIQLMKLNKYTCFSPDDKAEIERQLNSCK